MYSNLEYGSKDIPFQKSLWSGGILGHWGQNDRNSKIWQSVAISLHFFYCWLSTKNMTIDCQYLLEIVIFSSQANIHSFHQPKYINIKYKILFYFILCCPSDISGKH